MLLLGREGDADEELRRYAMQVKFNFEDMIAAPEMPGAFRLPIKLLPDSAMMLFKHFYSQKRDVIFQWAEKKGILLDKSNKLGPQIILLQRGEISVASNEVSISIVVPNPYNTQSGRVPVSVASAINDNHPAYSRHHLEVGDVLVLEGLEKLLVPSGDTTGEAKGLFLVSAVHSANNVGEGKEGWNETQVPRADT